MSKEHSGGTPSVALAPGVSRIVDFDWDSIDPDKAEDVKSLVMHKLKIALVAVLNWIHGEGSANAQGVLIRSYVAAWAVLPRFSGMQQAELTRRICDAIETVKGPNHKQSIGRQVAEFRDTFPGALINPHQRTDEYRESCEQRERTKRDTV